jgi:hypothetical protein
MADATPTWTVTLGGGVDDLNVLVHLGAGVTQDGEKFIREVVGKTPEARRRLSRTAGRPGTNHALSPDSNQPDGGRP